MLKLFLLSFFVASSASAGAGTLYLGRGDTIDNIAGEAVFSSTLNASGYGLRNYLVHSSTHPQHQPVIAVTAYGVCSATVTVTLRGDRYCQCKLSATINNAAGGSRDYGYRLLKNGVVMPEDDGVTPMEYTQTASGTSTEYIGIEESKSASTAGLQSYCVQFKTSSAAGTQSLRHLVLRVWEF